MNPTSHGHEAPQPLVFRRPTLLLGLLPRRAFRARRPPPGALEELLDRAGLLLGVAQQRDRAGGDRRQLARSVPLALLRVRAQVVAEQEAVLPPVRRVLHD